LGNPKDRLWGKITMKKKIVFVGLSGGVDSAVSAALLKKADYEVVGVFIKTWHPDFLVCNEEEERLDAMRVAAYLDIPFLTFDLADVYKKEVADYMIREYKAGRTPNPDVMCNKEVKFGAFLKKALAMGADFVATGHYANLTPSPSPGQERVAKGRVRLLKGFDPSKDQSYFLWTLNQKQLSKIIFPVGNLKKTEVRKLAKKFNLPVAEKKDSQGICFLGAVDLKDFLKHYIKEKKGKVILAPQEAGNKEGKEIGYHDGVVFHTLGERHGFTITKKSPTDSAYYVIGKDIKKNILIVSQNPARGVLAGNKINLNNTNWISGSYPLKDKSYTCQIRYHGEFLPCQVKPARQPARQLAGGDLAEIIFEKPVLVASGQSCVVYDKDVCLGGGVVV
jgi:tRNA-specific 2-thiouridylase